MAKKTELSPYALKLGKIQQLLYEDVLQQAKTPFQLDFLDFFFPGMLLKEVQKGDEGYDFNSKLLLVSRKKKNNGYTSGSQIRINDICGCLFGTNFHQLDCVLEIQNRLSQDLSSNSEKIRVIKNNIEKMILNFSEEENNRFIETFHSYIQNLLENGWSTNEQDHGRLSIPFLCFRELLDRVDGQWSQQNNQGRTNALVWLLVGALLRAKVDFVLTEYNSDLERKEKKVTTGSLDIEISHHSLWLAGYHWYKENQKKGARFSALNINERILPVGYKEAIKTTKLPIFISHNNGTELPIIHAIQDYTENLYLIGTGGIGKTTALMYIMKEAYDNKEVESYNPKSIVPLFIELSIAPDSYGILYRNGHSDFIHRSICRQVGNNTSNFSYRRNRDFYFTQDLKKQCEQLDDLFNLETERQEYLLLLDGLNEVSKLKVKDQDGDEHSIMSMLIEEIQELAECHNVRIILTSRTKDTEINCGMTHMHIVGLTTSTILSFLSESESNTVMKNRSLLEILRIPLFLIMYAGLDRKRAAKLSSRGEILRAFFNERTKNMETYTVQNRIDAIELNQKRIGKGSLKNRFSAKMQWFILDFLLPKIAWYMVTNEIFYVNKNIIQDIVIELLTDKSDIAVCGNYGQEFFTKYTNENDVSQHILSTAEELLLLGENKRIVTEKILNYCVFSLGLFQKSIDGFGFVHHCFRDYFAAIWIINRMKLAIYINNNDSENAYECLSDLRIQPIIQEICRLIGEVLGEHYNSIFAKQNAFHENIDLNINSDDQALIQKTLFIFQNKYNAYNDYGVFNLIEILKLDRKDLSEVDLSNLDLTQCNLDGVWLGNGIYGANLSGSKIASETLMLSSHELDINDIAYSPDGDRLASASDDGTIRIWNSHTGKCLKKIELDRALQGNYVNSKYVSSEYVNNSIYSVAFSPDGKNIVTTSKDAIVRVWDSYTTECIFQRPQRTYGKGVAKFSADGKYIIKVWNYEVEIWESITGECVFSKAFSKINSHKSDFTEKYRIKAFSSDGKRIAVAVYSYMVPYDEVWKKLEIWDFQTEDCLLSLNGHERSVISVSFSPDNHRIVTGSVDGKIRVWDANTGQCLLFLRGHTNSVIDVEYDPTGKYIVSAAQDSTIRIWDANSGHCIRIDRSSEYLHSINIAFSPDGKYIVYAYEKTIELRIFKTGQCIWRSNKRCYKLKSVAYSPDGKRLVSASTDGTIRIWDSYSGQCLRILYGHTASAEIVMYSPDGGKILSASKDKTIRIWDSHSGQNTAVLTGHDNVISSVAFNSDGKKIISVDYDSAIKIWDSNTGEQILPLIEDFVEARDAIFSPDDQQLLISGKGCIEIRDSHTGERILKLKDISKFEWPFHPIYSLDGNMIITISSDIERACKVWNSTSGECIYKAWYDFEEIAMSHDGKKIASILRNFRESRIDIHEFSTDPNKVWIKLAFSEKVLGRLKSLSFSSDGQRIAAATDFTIYVCDGSTGEIIMLLSNFDNLTVAGANLHNLHPTSTLSDIDLKYLWINGAQIDLSDNISRLLIEQNGCKLK